VNGRSAVARARLRSRSATRQRGETQRAPSPPPPPPPRKSHRRSPILLRDPSARPMNRHADGRSSKIKAGDTGVDSDAARLMGSPPEPTVVAIDPGRCRSVSYGGCMSTSFQ
jgi:hypothetical protein